MNGLTISEPRAGMYPEVVVTEYRSPAGEMLVGAYGPWVVMTDWTASRHRAITDLTLSRLLGVPLRLGSNEATLRAIGQLREYFAGERRKFDLALMLCGTPMQQAVWRALCTIGYGQTAAYSEVAVRAGKPQAVRAVASAVGRNPLSVVVPCHRVISRSGAIGGYAAGLEPKRLLLALEAERFLVGG